MTKIYKLSAYMQRPTKKRVLLTLSGDGPLDSDDESTGSGDESIGSNSSKMNNESILNKLILAKTFDDAFQIIKAISTNEESVFFSGNFPIEAHHLDLLLFKFYLLRSQLKNERSANADFLCKKCESFLDILLKKKILLMEQGKKIDEEKERSRILEALHKQYTTHEAYLAKLEILASSLSKGKKMLEEKKSQLMASSKISPSDKRIKLLSNAIGENEPTDKLPDGSVNITFKSLHTDIEKMFRSIEPVGADDLDDLSANFRYLTVNKINNPLREYKKSRNFLSRFKEWASDTCKKVFGVGTLSTKGTLKNLVAHQNRFFTIAKNKTKSFRSDPSLFSEKMGNQVKFYSNAYDTADRSSGTFTDMFNDMSHAKNIFIVGWALSISEKFGQQNISLPQLLVERALAGTKIVMLMWHSIAPEFKDHISYLITAIRVVMKRRNLSPREQETVSRNLHIKFSPREFGYSDHQKMVVVDAKLYVGGLDLADGRSEIESWHDCHSCIEGPIVKDSVSLMLNRWNSVRTMQFGSHKEGSRILEDKKVCLTHANHRSQKTDESSPNNEASMQLVCSMREKYFHHENWHSTARKQTRVHEIQNAYVEAIEKANNFIYMENQFFIGPRLHKNRREMIRGNNKVILAIAEKIKQKIASGEDFHFYCQLPLRPEGENPNSPDVQIILRKQWKTLDWLITIIDIEAKQHGKSAADYLTFYNLGRMVNDEYQMKYTHSKLLIVDDHELIIGSANCNERSMTGNRDSEVAVHMRGPSTQIRNYRYQLMCEHFGRDFIDQTNEFKFHPEKDIAHQTLHYKLDDNLAHLTTYKKAVATPWGNLPMKRLLAAEKPAHVLQRSPIFFRALAAVSRWGDRLVR